MKTLEEYIGQTQKDVKEFMSTPRHRKFQQKIQEECKMHGFWRRDIFWTRGDQPGSQNTSQISIGYHGPPDQFSKLGYMHCHDYFEMMYVYRGSCVNKMPEYSIRLQQGDIVLLNPNVLHCPHVEHEEDILLNICIGNDLIQRNIIPMLKDNQMFTTFFADFLFRAPDAKRFLYFDQNSTAICQLCESMCLEFFQKRDYYSCVLESSLMSLFALLAREYKINKQVPGFSSKDSQIHEILTYIIQHCADVSLQSLAQHFQYAPTYLSRLIKKQTGKTFSEIVHAQKMGLVTQYLSTTGLSVGEIASLAGFSDILHFNKVFKAEFGQTPQNIERVYAGNSRPQLEAGPAPRCKLEENNKIAGQTQG